MDEQVVDLLGVVRARLEKGDFTELESFDVLFQRASRNTKSLSKPAEYCCISLSSTSPLQS